MRRRDRHDDGSLDAAAGVVNGVALGIIFWLLLALLLLWTSP